MPTTATARATSETRSSVSSTNTTYVPTALRVEHPAGTSPAEHRGDLNNRNLRVPSGAFSYISSITNQNN